ncbi:hypothetical protein A9K55_003964 [Cordyceps militaris]|uniref:Uncharacterized protein n=1 Tax=Cordyceps militaris TaxID=73501 RepID=A0A2H4SL31_CORMI|nr:hypothetical protein A9K55_003964 [Cordyceps militaris]
MGNRASFSLGGGDFDRCPLHTRGSWSEQQHIGVLRQVLCEGGGRGRLESSTVEEEDKLSGRSAKISSRKTPRTALLPKRQLLPSMGGGRGPNPPVCPRYRSVLKIGMEIYPVIDRGLVSKVAVIGAVKAMLCVGTWPEFHYRRF